nr:uncharacterized protein [Tanacetum cinerariifolium]
MVQEHYDYDVLDFLLEETFKLEIINASSDEYCYDDESEDIDGVDFHNEGDHNVVFKNFTTTDPFLNQLCSNGSSFRGFIMIQYLLIEEFRLIQESRVLCKNEKRCDGEWCRKCVGEFVNDGGSVNDGEGCSKDVGGLWDYRQAILDSNLGSTCVLNIEELDSGAIYFKMFYVCFKGVKDGWLEGCRRLIGLDGCFLKHTYKGKLLITMRRDANNQMYLIAWAVVKVENNENWCWFLSLVHDDLNLNGGVNLTVILDSHKDLGGHSKWFSRVGVQGDGSYGVNLVTNQCKCRFWAVSGIPCVHVVARYMHLNRDPNVGVSEWYTQEKWFSAYQFSIKPVCETSMWKKTVHTTSGVVKPFVGEGVHNASDVVEHAVTEGLDQEEMIDKVVIAEGVSVASNTRGRNKGKKIASKTAPALPFKIYHKNKGRSERIAKMQAKKFKINDHGTGLSADKALNLSEIE